MRLRGRLFAGTPIGAIVGLPPLPPAALAKLVEGGDSITYKTSATMPSYARRAPSTFGLVLGSTAIIEFNGVNFDAGAAAAVSRGLGAPTDAANVNNNTIWSQRAAIVAAAPDTFTLLIGTNDLQYANTGANETERTTEWVSRIFAFRTWLRANGLPNLRFGAALVLPIGSGAVGAATHNSRRVIANGLLRAAVGTDIDFIIPFGESPLYGSDASPNTDFYDTGGIHPTSRGIFPMTRDFTSVMKPMADRVLAGSQPAQFSFRDQFNVAASTEVIEYITVTGLAMGATATATITGAGTMARGTGAFGTGPLTVMNGDTVGVKQTSSAAADTPVTSTVTIGDKSDTFTVRTAPATMVEFTSGATRAFAGGSPLSCVFPAGRPMIAISCQNDGGAAANPTVTIDGVAATRIGRMRVLGSTVKTVSLWVGPPSQTLTAGTYAVAYGSGLLGIAYAYPAALTNSTSAATGWSFTNRHNLYQTAEFETAWEAEGELLCPSGGLRVTFALAETNTNMVGGTLDRNFPNAGDELTYQQAWWFLSRNSDIPTLRLNLSGGNYAGFISASAQL